jgi:hypothetical protein
MQSYRFDYWTGVLQANNLKHYMQHTKQVMQLVGQSPLNSGIALLREEAICQDACCMNDTIHALALPDGSMAVLHAGHVTGCAGNKDLRAQLQQSSKVFTGGPSTAADLCFWMMGWEEQWMQDFKIWISQCGVCMAHKLLDHKYIFYFFSNYIFVFGEMSTANHL